MSLIDTKFNLMVSEHLNRKWEVVDATNPNQCFDVVVGWADYLGKPRSFLHLNAYQIWTNPTQLTRDNYELIANNPFNSPKRGDVVVWASTYNGGPGHTAVANGVGGILSFEAFSQNDPLGSVCIIRKYNYGNVLGWLRPKVSEDNKFTVKQLTALLDEAVRERRWE